MNHPAGGHRDTETGEMAHTGHELGQHWESHCSAISDSAQMLWQEGHTSVSRVYLFTHILGVHLWLQIHKIPCSFLAKMRFGARGLQYLKHGATNHNSCKPGV